MAKFIEVGKDVIEFPDNMTDAQIEQVLASQFGSTAKEQSKQQPAQPERKPSVWEEAGRQLGLTARAGITGIAGIPAMLAEPISAGINLAAGREVIPPQAQALQQFLTNIGLPEPKGGLERAVQAGASAMSGVGGQAQLAQKAGIAALAPLTREIPQQLAAAGAAGAVSQATSEKAAEVGFSPLENMAVTLASGTLAGLVGAKSTRMATAEKVVPVTMDQVKQEASRAYNRVDASGVSVKPLPLLKTIDDIESNLVNNQNFNPQLETHRPIKTVLDQMRTMVGSQRVSFTKLDQMRQAALDFTRGKDAATRRLAGIVVSELDNKISNLQPQEVLAGKANLASALKDIKEARDSWRKLSKATILEDALNIAEARALDPKASEGELIRTQFKILAANKDKMRLFGKEEQAAIRGLVSGSGSQKLLALAARFNPERSQLMTGMTIGAGMQNPYVAGGVAAGGFAADKALGVLQRKAAQDVMSQILAGKIKAPKENAGWRALIEAQMSKYSQEEQQSQ